jgi:protein gp37
MSKMFTFNGKPMQTWNPFTGCQHDCIYCWARPLATGRLKSKKKYEFGFAPAFHAEELDKKFKPGSFVFVSDMGDIAYASLHSLNLILDVIERHPLTEFLFCTKRPSCYFAVGVVFPANLYLGATIETNRTYPDISRAPSPFGRFMALGSINHPKKFVSIEPIMDFDLDIMVSWMVSLAPAIVEVGADNHGHQLPEPPADKVIALLAELRKFVPNVVEKEGLERLK